MEIYRTLKNFFSLHISGRVLMENELIILFSYLSSYKNIVSNNCSELF